jgi:hypothetical protein
MTATHSQEKLKRILLSEDENFILKPHPNPLKKYKVVWYRFPDRERVECKIDIYTPGNLNLPIMSDAQFKWFDNNTIASMPLLRLLLLTLHGWECHMDARHHNRTLQCRQNTDIVYIDALLILARKYKMHRRDIAFLPAPFLTEAGRRVIKFTESCRSTSSNWMALGFKTTGRAKSAILGLDSMTLNLAKSKAY